MAGLLGVETSFAKRKMNLGYRRAVLQADGPLGQAGQALTGHEFHYATIVSTGDDPPFAVVTDPHGSAPAPAGSRRGHVTGSFFHAIAVGRPREQRVRSSMQVSRSNSLRRASPSSWLAARCPALPARCAPGRADRAAAGADAELSPSVGHSQPWRWVRVHDEAQRAPREQFQRCNADALPTMRASGRGSMPASSSKACARRPSSSRCSATMAPSAATALAGDHAGDAGLFRGRRDHAVLARGADRGRRRRLGLDPGARRVREALDAPPDWKLIAWLCVGWPEEESPTCRSWCERAGRAGCEWEAVRQRRKPPPITPPSAPPRMEPKAAAPAPLPASSPRVRTRP
jgi:hypothetical protein